jgi:lysozyme family protein
MTPFEEAWAATGRAEGGYADNPLDSGGETNHGITKATARLAGYKGRMVDLSAAEALRIAKTAYWDVLRGDELAEINPRIAREVFDSGILCGTGTAARWLQRSLNAFNRLGRDYHDQPIDGKIGGKTLTALRLFLELRRQEGVTVMLRSLNSLLGAHLITLTEAREKDEIFLFGWFWNRVAL